MSTGGNFAAVMAHRARDDPTFANHPLTGQILSMPLVIHPDVYPEHYKSELLSVEQNRDALLINAAFIRQAYTDFGVQPNAPEASPLLYPSHEALVPAYIQVCGLDPLRDEGLLYTKVLQEAGVKTKVDIYPGVPHGFYTIFPEMVQAIKFEKDLKTAITWLLDSEDTGKL